MKTLIHMVNDEPRISHRIIAENTNNEQRAINQLIRDNLSDFQEFGEVNSTSAKIKTAGGLQKQKTYYLNEAQATLLMTYLRNSDVVRKFKKSLVKEFFAMREALNPHIDVNIYEINGRIGWLTSANIRYANKIASLEEQIIELKQMNPFQITEVYDNCESFMNDPCLHNNFLEFLYQANKAVHEVNIIRHLSPGLDSTHQSLSNFMLHMTRRYEKVRGVKQYRYN